MEVAAGSLVAAVAGYQGYSYIRSHVKTTVNCWFCNENSRVEYRLRNSFICPHCDQYNGFTASGDYNKDFVKSGEKEVRFCINAQKPPDVIEQSNGLCLTCNAKQSLIIEKLGEFEPINEEKWDDEYEVYKYKLDKLYPLCQDCTLRTHQKLQGDKQTYGHLLDLKYRLLPAVTGAFKTVGRLTSKIARRHRRQFFAGGQTTEASHWVTFGLSLLLFIAHLNYLQEDADVVLLPLPMMAKRILPVVVNFSFQICLCALILHFVAIAKNKSRTTLPDLLFPVLGLIHATSFGFCEETYREDLAVCRCAISALMSVLASAVTFVPRKKLHRRKPNRIITSAFSVASTPESQCSSQDELSFAHEECRSERTAATTRITKTSVRNRFQWREREMSPEIEVRTPKRTFFREQSPEAMDWEPTPAPSVVSSRLGRETTPARELAPSLSGLSLAGSEMNRHQSIFRPPSELPDFSHDLITPLRKPFDQRSQFGARSLASGITSVSRSRPLHHRGNDSPPAPSVFTSVSQQQPLPTSPLALALLALLLISSLLCNITVMYFLFSKKNVSSSED